MKRGQDWVSDEVVRVRHLADEAGGLVLNGKAEEARVRNRADERAPIAGGFALRDEIERLAHVAPSVRAIGRPLVASMNVPAADAIGSFGSSWYATARAKAMLRVRL